MSSASQTARQVFRAPVARAPQPVRQPSPASRAGAAAAVSVSQHGDATEREARQVARRIVGLPAPVAGSAAAATGPASAAASRSAASAATRPSSPLPPPLAAVVAGGRSATQAMRAGGAAAGAGPARATAAAPARASLPGSLGLAGASGRPLPPALLADMEPRFGADFSAVRIHTGDDAARASRRLNAAAFTAGRDIFFGRGRFQPEAAQGRELIAHELTHTIQQGAAAQPGRLNRSEDTTVRERASPEVPHRLGIQDALDYFADKAAWIPGFSLLSLLLGFNPVSLRAVQRTGANLLRALIQLLPGGPLITQALDNHGIVDRVATWAEGQLSALGDIGSAIRQAIDDFLDGLSWTDIFDLAGVWERAKRIVTTPIDRIIAFGTGLISGIITFIKDAILRPLGALAEGTRGYPLLKAVLGFDPVTGEAVPRTPAALIGGFMTLIGQEEVWQNIQRGNAIGQAWAWFQTAMGELVGFAGQIPGLFLAAFRSLELMDIILVPRAFMRIAGVFGGFIGRFLSWAGGTVIKLLEIIFSVVAPGAMGYLRRAGAAIQGIFRNPIGFVRNLVRAGQAGFQRFAGNFVTHLQAGLIAWLTGSLPGIYIPQGFNLPEILKFVLSVLGLTWANVRGKLVNAVGEPAVRAMEMGFEIVVTLVRDGPAAAWDQLRESLANLRSMVIDGIVDMVTNFVVTRALPRLLAMFIPGAGFITAIMGIYNTVMTVVNQLARIVQVVTAFLDSMMAIAAGNIDAAASRVESTLANLLTLAINFLAGFAGLGRVADRVRAVIERIRAPIDRALDRVIAWIVRMGQRFMAAARAGVRRAVQWWTKRRAVGGGSERHSLQFDGTERAARLMVHSDPATPVVFVSQFSTLNGSAPHRAEVASAQAEVTRLQGELATAQAAASPDPALVTRLDGELTREFNRLGAALDAILALADGEGTEQDPLPIDYPKRRASAYPTIYVGPRSEERIPQTLLQGLPRTNAKQALLQAQPSLANTPGFVSWDGVVRTYIPTGGANQTLPDGGVVGLGAQFASIAPGARLRYDDKGSTGGGGKINRMFRPFGFRASGERMDGDHVMERQIGGPDEIVNLWPLERSENRSSGATVKGIAVRYKREQVNIHTARTRRGREIYLLIRRVVG